MSRKVVATCLAAIGIAGASAAALWRADVAASTDESPATEARLDAFRGAENALVRSAETRDSVGRVWWAGRFENGLGEQCVEIRSPTGWRAMHCPPRAKTDSVNFVADEVVGTSGDTVWVMGLAHPNTATVKLVLSDCREVIAPVTNGVFVYVAPAGLKVAQVVPRDTHGDALLTRDAGGLGASAASC